MKPRVSTLKEQRLNAELGAIVDDMGKAMWNANKEYIAICEISIVGLTINMRDVLYRYKEFCERNYGKKV